MESRISPAAVFLMAAGLTLVLCALAFWQPAAVFHRPGRPERPAPAEDALGALRRLVRHYADGPVDGLILAATSGEGMSLDIAELEQLVDTVRAELSDIGRALPLCLGLSGASTKKMQGALDETATWPIDGYLIASPYYTRPSQRGLVQHFTALADHAAWPIALYNIPYRTAVNLTNDTLLRLRVSPSPTPAH